VAALITRIEDETMRIDDRGRTEVVPVGPEHGARRGAGSAEDALRGVVEGLTLFGRLQTFASGLMTGGDEERHDLTVGLEEGLHVHDHVLLERQALDRLDGDRLGRVEILQQGLAGQTVAAVDAHGIRTAHTMGTGPAEGQRAVDLPLDLVQGIEHTVGALHGDVVLLPVRLRVLLGIEPCDEEGAGEGRNRSGLARDVIGKIDLRRRLSGCCIGAHQYLRSIAWLRVTLTGFVSRRMPLMPSVSYSGSR